MIPTFTDKCSTAWAILHPSKAPYMICPNDPSGYGIGDNDDEDNNDNDLSPIFGEWSIVLDPNKAIDIGE